MPAQTPKATDIDEYIANAPAGTRPILAELRRVFLQASPRLEETLKWGVPFYSYKGPVGGFAAYKAHVSWGLWKARLLNDPDGIVGNGIKTGGKIRTIDELPSPLKLIGLIRQAIALNEAGIKPRTPEPDEPEDFKIAMKAWKPLDEKRDAGQASTNWDAFSPARKWQYVNWINQAKRTDTRARRIATAVEQIARGRPMK